MTDPRWRSFCNKLDINSWGSYSLLKIWIKAEVHTKSYRRFD